MSASQSPSSIPPRRARYVAVTGLIVSVSVVLTAYATRLSMTPIVHEPPARTPANPNEVKPIPVPAKEPPTTDEGVVSMRILRDHTNAALIEHRDHLAVESAESCLLKEAVRHLYARVVQLEGGKRGKAARNDFEDRTVSWERCTPGERVDLRKLHEAADSALRR
jgi:hypothetical protein